MGKGKETADMFSQWMHDTVAMVLCAGGDFDSADRVPLIVKELQFAVQGNRPGTAAITREDARLLVHGVLRWAVKTLDIDVEEIAR